MPQAYKVVPIPAEDRLKEKIVRRARTITLNKIAVIDVDGVITGYDDLLGKESPLTDVIEKLQRAWEDRFVKAIVLRIDSPGGEVTASDIIYRKLCKIREGDRRRDLPAKPIVASMQGVCASGGYYIACGADKIVAEPTSITGSIGVIILAFNIRPLLDKIGVYTETIKSGDKKDALSPFRPLSPEEKRLFQQIIDQLYERFLTVVSSSRRSSEEKIRPLADGRVFTGEDAVRFGLVDMLGGLEDAIDLAKSLAGIKDAHIVMYHRPWGYKGSIYAKMNHIPQQIEIGGINMFNVDLGDLFYGRGKVMYLWLPQADSK